MKNQKQSTLAGFFKAATPIKKVQGAGSPPLDTASPTLSSCPTSSGSRLVSRTTEEVDTHIDSDDECPTNVKRPKKRRKVSKVVDSDEEWIEEKSTNTTGDRNVDLETSSSCVSPTVTSSCGIRDLPLPSEHVNASKVDLSSFVASKKPALEPGVYFDSSESKASAVPILHRESSSKMSSHVKLLDKQERLMEEGYQWLKPGHIKDADGNTQDSPMYNPRTLYIPKKVLANFSPFEAQFWQLKSQNFDSVLFFQKGKFFELYEEDAVLAHRLFDWKMSSRGLRMAGVPDYTFDQWAAKFVAKGYRVARVDQMESILGKEIRDRTSGKKEKIVRRELTQVLTQGTLVDEAMLLSDMSTFIMSIKELECATDFDIPRFGAVFADTATGQFYYSSFKDDAARTKLDTLLSQIKPRELVLEKGQLSPITLKAIKGAVSADTIFNHIRPESEFWDDSRTLQEFTEAKYFGDLSENWPVAASEFTRNSTALSAFGGLLWYLKNLRLDHDLCSMGNFEAYDPVRQGRSLVLDGQSLVNLEIFSNTWDGGSQGTLFSILQHCITPFGKRLLKLWVCHPLLEVVDIEKRLDAVEYLMRNHEVRDVIKSGLSKLPDLERMLSRLHCGRCKVVDFLKVLGGFRQLIRAVDECKSQISENNLLRTILHAVPDMHSKLDFWEAAFDWDTATPSKDENGKIVPGLMIPTEGTYPEFDDSQRRIDAIEAKFIPLLKEYQKELKSSKIAYKNLGQSKEIYQIEVPSSLKVPKDWNQLSSTKAVTRYWSPVVAKLVRELLEAQETHKMLAEQLQIRFFKQFDEDYKQWSSFVAAIAKIDCLYSLAISSTSFGLSCRPRFVAHDGRGTIDFKDLRHPCSNDAAAADFIPNDISLGGATSNMSLLTGPNMAGKSTLLRSTCVGVVLAHLGHYVPASSATLSPVDQVFVRTGGAKDNIIGSQSTFMVELNETATILSNATSRSLVVLDELGRGTSTHDGMAVAYSVLHQLSTYIGCLGFFSTHYSNLTSDFTYHPEISLKTMSYLLDDHKVTFLYKLVDGVCSHSHGLNVARMAGIPESVIQTARVASAQFDASRALKPQDTLKDKVVGLPLGVTMDLERLMARDFDESSFTKDQILRILTHLSNILQHTDAEISA